MASEKKLNPKQQAAVNHGPGPLLIIAGAGTGKTTVITHRIARLIESNTARPDQILAVTFTEKAASEMEFRLDELLPYGVVQTTVCTFHGLCDRILRDDAFHVGLPQNYTLITPGEAIGLVKKHIFDFELDYFRPLGNPDKFIYGLLTHVDRLRDEDISPEAYSNWVKSLKKKNPEQKLDHAKYSEISMFYRQYQRLKLETRVMDFADLIYYTLNLFRLRPNILKEYQLRWPWILVDEYQDTNYSQTQLIKLLGGQSPNLTVVADDDQAIYRWRGAAVSNVLEFTKDYPKAKKIVLAENFRSTQTILDAAYSLIVNNNPDRLEVQAGIPKRLVSTKPSPNEIPVLHLHYPNGVAEAEGITAEIQLLKSSDPNLLWSDFAILVRANSHADPIIKSLSAAGIPFRFLGPGRLLYRPEIRDLIAYLRLLVNPYDEVSLFRVLSAPWAAVEPTLIADQLSASRRQKRPLYDVVMENSNPQISRLMSLFDSHRLRLPVRTAGEILYDLLRELDWLPKLMQYKTTADEEIAANIVRFFNKLRSHETSRADASVPAVIDWLDFMSEAGESPQATEPDLVDSDAINVITVHSAKGMEFKVVFIPSLVSSRFPSVNRSEAIPIPEALIKERLPSENSHLQEERRLFYVAMTRAMDRLYLTSADSYGDSGRLRKPSPFIFEALGKSHQTVILSVTPVPPSSIKKPLVNLPPRPVTIDYLDYSRIKAFRDCPLHFKAKYLLNLSPPLSAASTFGTVIHKTLKDYFSMLKRGEKPDIFALLQANWDPLGYASKKQEILYKEKGHRLLKNYVSKLDPKSPLPVKLEEQFKFQLSPGLTIGGKIDRLDLHPDGTLEVIDYKTSSPNGEHNEKSASSDLQLSIYALAASRFFKHRPEKILLTFYYLDSQTAIRTRRTEKQLETATLDILKIKSQIESSDFSCSNNLICRQNKCDYRELCSS